MKNRLSFSAKISVVAFAAAVLVFLGGFLTYRSQKTNTSAMTVSQTKPTAAFGATSPSESGVEKQSTTARQEKDSGTREKTTKAEAIPADATEVQTKTAETTKRNSKRITVESYLKEQGDIKSETFAVRNAAPEGKVLCLTFDDGPNPKTTLPLLDTLKKYNAKCTFFVVGYNIKGREEILRRIVEEGHTIGNHSQAHQSVAKQELAVAKAELEQVNRMVAQASGYTPVCFRPPYADFPRNVEEFNGMWVSWWSFDSEDWRLKDAKKIADSVIADVKNQDVIIMHDIHAYSVESVELILEKLTEEGYRFVTYEEMMGLQVGIHN